MEVVKKITLDCWKHIPAGAEVESGYTYKLTAPQEAGFYTLYQLVYSNNIHAGWVWEREGDANV